jgi:uncharacterized surface protein with fasciclin (FAS1) repeats
MSSTPPLGTSATIGDLLARSGTGFDADSSDFDLLNQALADTGLASVFADRSAGLTLFAPTDAAFLSLARSLGFEGDDEAAAYAAIGAALTGLAPDGNPIPLLTQVLTYHVTEGALARRDIVGATEIPTLLEGATLRPFGNELRDGDPDAADPRLIGRGETASNGRLQAIDGVLLPLDLPGNGNGNGAAPLPTIAGLLSTSGTGFDSDAADFDILNAALAATGLTGALDDAGASLTLFAPTDAAFLQLAGRFGYEGRDEAEATDAILDALGGLAPGGDATALLRDVLLYHVVEGQLSLGQARAADGLQTLAGGEIELRGTRVIDAEPDGRDARLVPGATDREASNGAVQAIDRVLLPIDLELPVPAEPSIAGIIAGSGEGFDRNRQDFDMLRAAVDAAGLTAALDDPSANLTLFAPTDAAFLQLARNLGYRGSDEGEALGAILDGLAGLSPDGDPLPLLTQVLTTYVAPRAQTVAEITASLQVETLSGVSLSPFGRTLIDADPTLPDARIISGRTDLEASNGVVQAINRVILPADIPEARGSIEPHGTIAGIVAASGDGPDAFGGDFDLLNAALRATGLDAALDDRGAQLTLLAPTDDAFVSLAQALGYHGEDEAGALDAILGTLGELGGGDPVPVLTDILLQHVISGRFSREQLSEARSADPLEGVTLGFQGRDILDAEPSVDAEVIRGGDNVLADNGALHAISGVLLPLNLDIV